MLGTVEPDRFYTLYGDATEQRFEAATSRKLFVKLERRQFAALFGDFETGLTLTELTRYSRTFTGSSPTTRASASATARSRPSRSRAT